MKFNSFDTTVGRLCIALDRRNNGFVYMRPEVVEKEPDLFVPYDFIIETRGLVEENGNTYQRYARIPTEPTKQEVEG